MSTNIAEFYAEGPVFWPVGDVARRLGVSTNTIWRWSTERTDFPRPCKIGPRSTRWKKKDIEAFAAKFEVV